MKTRWFRYVTIMLALLAWSLTVAQDSVQPAVTIIESPVMEGMREPGDFSWVQMLNLSSNAGEVSLELVTADSTAAVSAPEEFRNIAYLAGGGYVQFPSGRYRVNVLDAQGTGLHTEEITLDGSRFYTLALLGLQVPPEAAAGGEAEPAGEGGFLPWLRGLFGADDGGDRFSLRLLTLQDELNRMEADNSLFLRVVNAAPGTEGISLAMRGETDLISGSVAYGEAGRYNEMDLAALTGPLELRIGDSQAATVSLESAMLQPGTVNTVFAVGTPTEETPLHALIMSTPVLGSP